MLEYWIFKNHIYILSFIFLCALIFLNISLAFLVCCFRKQKNGMWNDVALMTKFKQRYYTRHDTNIYMISLNDRIYTETPRLVSSFDKESKAQRDEITFPRKLVNQDTVLYLQIPYRPCCFCLKHFKKMAISCTYF